MYLVMQCPHCGFSAEFDQDFFDPAYLRERVRPFSKHASWHDYEVLVALAEEPDPTTLITAARAMAKCHDGEVLALHIGTDEHPGVTVLERSMTLGDLSVPLVPVVRMGERVDEIIISAARDYHVDRLLLGWRGTSRTRGVFLGSTLDYVVAHAPCDVIVVKDRGWPAPLQRILVPAAGGPNSQLALEVAGELAQQSGAAVTGLYVESPGRDEASHKKARGVLDAQMKALPEEITSTLAVEQGQDVVRTILQAAADHDLTIIGATQEGLFQQLMFGNVPERIARENPQTTFMVKRHAPLRRWLRRVFGTRS
ncbi:MAG: universal stress protein [Vicinamibacterales bacterium]